MKRESVIVELDWFFSERIGAAGELGAPSTYQAMEAQSLAGAGSGSNAIGSASAAHDRMIRALPAAARMRALADVLHRMPLEQQLVLEHAHADSAAAVAARRDFQELLGDVAPVVIALHGREAVREMVDNARRDVERRARVVELRLVVERAVAEARTAFWALACERSSFFSATARTRREERMADVRARLQGAA